MRKAYVAVIALLGISSCFLHVDAQDISFPGVTERPSRFPLDPGTKGQSPSQNTTVSQEQYNTCVGNCKFTSEYNPICGSDGVTYQNPGALNCAVNCGNPVQNLGRAPCTTTTTTSRPVTAPTNGQNNGISQEQYNNCIDNCRFTTEYNPVCGSDGVTYQNPGALNCAVNCGNPVQNLGRAPCTNTRIAAP